MADSGDVGERDRTIDGFDDDGSGDNTTVGAIVGMPVTMCASTTVPIVAS